MKPPTSVFQLARMRHLDLLALWWQLSPDARGGAETGPGRMTKDALAAAITALPREPRT